MKKAYHLTQCSTCQRILNELNWKGQLQDIRTEKISSEQLDQMAKMSGSYESLFSRRALKYKSMGLKNKTLSENDYRQLILEKILSSRDQYLSSTTKYLLAIAKKLLKHLVLH